MISLLMSKCSQWAEAALPFLELLASVAVLAVARVLYRLGKKLKEGLERDEPIAQQEKPVVESAPIPTT